MVSDWFKKRRQFWLCKAAEKGKTKTVRILLKLGADIDGEWEDNTPLEWAVGEEHVATSEFLLENGAKIRARTLCISPKMTRLLLDRGADVDMKFENGQTLLMAASDIGRYNSLPLMRLLIERGADVNKRLDGETILMMSVRCEVLLVQVPVLLIRYGADVQARDKRGCTALMRCHYNWCDLLIASGIDIDAQDFAGNTALMHAAELGESEAVRQLLEHRANTSLVNHKGGTAFSLAVENGHTRVVRKLLKHGVAVVIGETDSAHGLMLVAAAGDNNRVHALLNSGCDVDVFYMGRTAVLWAAELGHEKVVQTLLEHGADVNKGDDLNRRPLSLAAQEGHVQIVRLLLQLGADINHANQDKITLPSMLAQWGWTPLMLAAYGGHLETVQVLLEHGAEINAKSTEGYWTAIKCAVDQSFPHIVRLLLDYGADVHMLGADFCRNFHRRKKLYEYAEIWEELFQAGVKVDLLRASRLGSMKIVTALLDGGENVNQGGEVLSQAIISRNIELVRFLLERGAKADIDSKKQAHLLTPLEVSMQWHSEIPVWLMARGAKGSYKALKTAASNGYTDYVKMLLDAGIKTDSDDPLETTALWRSASDGHAEVVRLLLQHGANVNRKAGDNTALMEAAERGHTEVVSILLAAGADREIEDEIGWTALKYAEESNHTEIIQLLTQAQS